jgi:hypothetical protein
LGCSSLTSVIVPDSVEYMGNNAFHHDYTKIIYGYKGSAAEAYATANNIQFIDITTEKTNNDSIKIPESPKTGCSDAIPFVGMTVSGIVSCMAMIKKKKANLK